MSQKTQTTTHEQTTETDEITTFRTDRMRDAHYWAAQLRGWFRYGPNGGIDGTYYVEIIGGRPVAVFDDTWNESKTQAVVDGLREHNFPEPLRVKHMEMNDNMRLFIMEPTDDRLNSNFIDNWRAFDSASTFADSIRDE